jgi:hypothetical protein
MLTGLGRFMRSPQYRQLCQRYNVETLRQITPALNIEDRIRALIRKRRLLDYPQGSAFAGIWCAYTLRILSLH